MPSFQSAVLALMGFDDAVIMIAISLALAATMMVLSELLRPKPKMENARPSSLGDFRFPTAEEGRPIPVVWGTVKIDGPNVVWYGDLKQTPITKKLKTGLWSSRNMITGYKYNVGMQLALCKGPIDQMTVIWCGDTEVYHALSTGGSMFVDSPGLFGGDDLGSGGVQGIFRLYTGSLSQTIGGMDYIRNFQSPSVPYKGTCFVVWEGGYIGNSTSIQPFKFELRRCPNQLGLSSGKHIVNSADANPAACLYELLTDTDWGLGFAAGDIDASSFITAGNTLFTEGNGYSVNIDTSKETVEVLSDLERQIDGLVLLNMTTGKWELKLARADYDINTVPLVDDTNILECNDFTRGTWEETTNQVRVQFTDRAKAYNNSFAVASDLANQRVQLGALIPSTVNFPGCKDATLAAMLAARSLRYLSIPLAKATLVVDRTFWQVRPGDVVAWTDASRGFVKLPMRVAKVKWSDGLKDNKIELTCVQDVFQFATSADGVNQATRWTAPTEAVSAFPAGQQIAQEAPWALVRRDPDHPGVVDRIFAAGRAQGLGEVSFKIYERHSAGSTSGAYADAGEVFGFMFMGSLRTGIGAGDANPTSSVGVDPSPDTVAGMLAEFFASPAPSDMGQNLVNLIRIDDEYMAVTAVADHTSWMECLSVYRGLLDSVPTDHSVGAPVYLIASGAGLSDTTIPRGNNVDVKLCPRSKDAEVAQGSATTVSFAMADRCRKPYPPFELSLNGTRFQASVNVDTMKAGGTTDDDRGIVVSFKRRDYRVFDEVAALAGDAAGFVADFPTANTHENDCDLIRDPAGAHSLVKNAPFAAGTSFFFSRTRLLANNAGAKPSTLRVEVGSRHTYEAQVLSALKDLGFTFSTASSELDNDTNMGVLTNGVVGAAYTAPVNGTYHFTTGVTMGIGQVEARINGGGWSAIIAAGLAVGDLAGVTAGDTIEVRHTQVGTSETFLRVDAPGTNVDAYAVLVL